MAERHSFLPGGYPQVAAHSIVEDVQRETSTLHILHVVP